MSPGPEQEPVASTQERVAIDSGRLCARDVLGRAMLSFGASEADKSKRRRE